ncbi:MAG: C_GCAxxG_C_C family protein, partial [Oscillospiraceae bacterium]|nr:C_GCAxxG_C_C family protein [Oscillospiraceae bacterium]
KLGIELPLMVKLASSFGGGVAGTREMCGTVSGMLLVAGLIRGYSDASAREEKQEHYAFCRSLMDEFAAVNGSIICRELLRMQKDGESKKLSCRELCILAADILAEKADI